MSARILVVEDEADIRRLICLTLRRAGYLVTEAGAGDVGLELIRQQRPDLVVLDQRMPGMSGLDVVRALASDLNLPPVPVVMVTASVQQRDAEAAVSAGVAAYLPKPFAPRQLAAAVAKVLASHGNGAV